MAAAGGSVAFVSAAPACDALAAVDGAAAGLLFCNSSSIQGRNEAGKAISCLLC